MGGNYPGGGEVGRTLQVEHSVGKQPEKYDVCSEWPHLNCLLAFGLLSKLGIKRFASGLGASTGYVANRFIFHFLNIGMAQIVVFYRCWRVQSGG